MDTAHIYFQTLSVIKALGSGAVLAVMGLSPLWQLSERFQSPEAFVNVLFRRLHSTAAAARNATGNLRVISLRTENVLLGSGIYFRNK